MMHKIIQKALHFRHACKEFNKEKMISTQDITSILESARLAPSSLGLEPRKFLVIQNKKIQERISSVCGGGTKSIPSASHVILVLARQYKDIQVESKYINYIIKEVQKLPKDICEIKKGYLDHIIKSMTNEEVNQRCQKQTYIPLTNMMYTASLLEIDSCPIEGFDAQALKKILHNEYYLELDNLTITTLLPLGYRIKEPRKKTRQEINKVIKFVK